MVIQFVLYNPTDSKSSFGITVPIDDTYVSQVEVEQNARKLKEEYNSQQLKVLSCLIIRDNGSFIRL